MIICKKICAVVSIILLVTIVSGDTFGRSGKDKTVIQSNHFTSSTDVSISYTLYNVEGGKPLVFLLKRKSAHSSIKDNHLTVSFNSQNQTHSCKLKTENDICVIEEVEESSITLNIQCARKPCDVSWVIYQPEINKINNGQLGQGLFTLQQSNDHMVAFITCNDPQNKGFAQDVLMYASSPFDRGGSGNKLYFLFANEEKGFLYVDIREESRKCAHISIANVPKKVKYSDQLLRDYTNKHSSSIIGLNIPKSDFRLDCMLTKLDDLAFETATIVTLSGLKGNSTQILSQYSINPLGKEKSIEFSITFKKPQGDYDSLELQIVGKDEKMTMISFVINQAKVQQVDLSQRSYFKLKKGQSISYQLLPDEKAEDFDQIYFLPNNNTHITLSQANCSAKRGCTLELTADDDVSTYLFVSSTPDATKKSIQYIPLSKNSKKKIKEKENIYFRKQMKTNKAFQIAINSPNVIVYAASKKKCETPDATCNERSGNYLHPFAYNPKNDGDFIISVQGLQSGEFMISVIEEDDEYIHLDDGVAFSYRIEEDEEEILFKYKLKEKMDVSFNLVAPLNHLNLFVYNGDEEPDETSSTISSEGYITYMKNEIRSLKFIITVKKTELTKKKMTHFTLIASSSKAVVRLEPTVAHYETLQPQATREYIFEFDPTEDYILNFYTHNFKANNLSIMLALSNNRVWSEKNLDMLWIDRESDFLDLKLVSSYLCKKQGQESCQIFLLLKNQMTVDVDITITLMMRYSIIELKDGIWQSYLEGTIASDAFFYFYPKHIDKNTVILYTTPMEDLRITYTLWKSDSKSLNPTEWPFPRANKGDNNPSPRTVNHVTIDKELLKKQCWPNCVVLITLYRDPNLKQTRITGDADYKIMASNNQIQLPEKTRINLVLRSNEEKELIIDLKYVLSKQYLTIYTYNSIGNFALFANVISEKQSRCPQESQQTDFVIDHGETTIDVSRIKFKMRELNMQSDGNIYLCLLAKGVEDGKFSIEYTTDRSQIQLLHFNSYQTLKLQTNETKIYQMEGYFNFLAKIIRKSGYPYFLTQKCDLDKIKQCEEAFVSTLQIGKQLVKKYEEFYQPPCQDCMYYFKFHAIEPCTIVLHLNTMNSQTELKQHEIITDFVEPGEEARFTITHIKKEDLSVNIHVIEGDIQVTFTNYEQVSLLKSTQTGKKSIHFFIPKSYSYANVQPPAQNGIANFGSYQYSDTFGSYHMVIKSKNIKGGATFSITYSSGENQVMLQDGLITDMVLQPNVPFKFYYENEISHSHIYLTLSAREESVLSALNLSSFYFEGEGEEETQVEFHIDIPKIRKKTPNPAYLLSLPQKNYLQIDLINPSSKAEVISIGINHQELIILPFDHEFPFTLHAKEEINFLVEVSSPGFIHTQIRKCDESQPLFSYSFDYYNFVKGEFQNQIELTEDPKFQDFIKVSKAGSFYINIKAIDQASILAINLKYLAQKPKAKLLKAGGRGVIEYELTDSKKATLQFSQVLCNSGDCLGIKYYSMASTKITDLYSQLVCPSSFFSIDSMQTSEEIIMKPIQYNESNPIVTFIHPLTHHSSFVAVKAVTGSGQQIYYRPIEIVTIWGHLSRTSQSYKITIGCILIVSICALLLFVRYNARKGYRRIEESESSKQ